MKQTPAVLEIRKMLDDLKVDLLPFESVKLAEELVIVVLTNTTKAHICAECGKWDEDYDY